MQLRARGPIQLATLQLSEVSLGTPFNQIDSPQQSAKSDYAWRNTQDQDLRTSVCYLFPSRSLAHQGALK